PAKPCPAVTTDCVDLVDEDNARRILFALDKKVAHARCAHADEHFNKVRTADAEERHTGPPADAPSQSLLASPRSPHEKAPFGDPPAELGKLFRIFQEG